MPETFGERLSRVRRSKIKAFDRCLSQEDAARLFCVSISAYRKWERGRSLPDRRSRDRMEEVWPEVFAKEAPKPPR